MIKFKKLIKGEWRNWQTRTTQNRVPYGMWVRIPPRPLSTIKINICFSNNKNSHPQGWELKKLIQLNSLLRI